MPKVNRDPAKNPLDTTNLSRKANVSSVIAPKRFDANGMRQRLKWLRQALDSGSETIKMLSASGQLNAYLCRVQLNTLREVLELELGTVRSLIMDLESVEESDA